MAHWVYLLSWRFIFGTALSDPMALVKNMTVIVLLEASAGASAAAVEFYEAFFVRYKKEPRECS